MERLARFATRRPVAVTVLAVAVALLGWIAWRQLPLDLLPDIQSPTVVVSVRSGDRPPIEMERLYGEQLEQRLFTVRGIREVAQVARTGRLIATVVFDWDADVDLGLVDVQKAVGPMESDPRVDEVLVRRFDPRQAPVVTVGLIAPDGRPDLAELRSLARRQVGPALEQLAGVAEVRVLGGRERQIEVRLDRRRLDSLGVALETIERRLSAANVDVAAGTLEEGSSVFLVRGLSRFRSPADVAAVVVRYEEDEAGRSVPLRVGDLASVVESTREIEHLILVDGQEGVGLGIYKEGGANTVAVSRTVRRALDDLAGSLPGVEVRLVSDEAALVEDAIEDVQVAAGVGVLLAIIVLALFLRSAGPTVVVASAVPVSILAALFLMRFGGQSLNLMTLAGLALGAGMLVDNAIVVVESIHRRLSAGEGPEDAAARGTGDVAGAIAASTLTTCVVFLPVLFVRGLAARLVGGIAFAVVSSLAASLVVAVLLIPALSRWLLARRPGAVAAGSPAGGEASPAAPLTPSEKLRLTQTRAEARIERLVGRLLGRPGLVVVAALLACAGAGAALWSLGNELLPPGDPRQFSLRLIGAPGQRVEATAEVARLVEDLLRQAAGDDLEATLSEVGRLPEDDRQLSAEQTEESTARVRVRLAAAGASGSQVVARTAPALDGLTGVEIEWEVGASAFARALGTRGPPVVIEIAGRALPDLRSASDRLAERLAARPELWSVRSSFEGGPPELRVVLDRVAAEAIQLDLTDVGRVLETYLDGRQATSMMAGDEERGVVLKLPSPRREDLPRLTFQAPDGRRVALGQIARFEVAEGAREIFRRDQRRVAQVTARIAEGADFPGATAAARKVLAETELPPGLSARLAGEEEERAETYRELGWAGWLALLLVLMVLAGTFESLIHPLTVLAAVPLALVGVAVALVPLGRPIGVMAALGAIVLAGVAVNDAILLLAAARQGIAEGLESRAALARAAALRLRPILMTTLTTVLALLPLVFGTSDAARLRSPMALTLIGGLIASTLGSLLVIPCFYLVLDRLRLRRRTAAP